VYATEQQDGAEDPASRDIQNQAFWERLEGMFREAREMLEEMMKAHGIEIDPAALAEEEEREKRRHEETWSHPCAVAGNKYAKAVRAWFEAAGPRFEKRAEELESQDRLKLHGAEPEGEARRLREATEVIHWYQHQIAVKIMRAVGSARRDGERDVELDRSDTDGSAKVALIGMDRSLAAWSEMLRQLPDEEDHILSFLAALSRLRREIEAAFPHARAFIRPGFDTGDAMMT
jgi:pentatricopeptide repeat protein